MLDGHVRDDEHVGLCNVPRATPPTRSLFGDTRRLTSHPRRSTRSASTAWRHSTLEWAELGEKVLGERDVPTILDRLRNDRSLRFTDSSQIVDVVTGALERAEAARDEWFPPYRIAECTVEEIHPIEAKSAALAHYVSPASNGSRPGTHWVLTINPEDKFTYEYEALAFHESTPGHHLQVATAQTLTDLPDYRRYLDAQVCGFVEGWGLYSERLADEMGLYTSDLARLGMLSFDSLRACRLVVDTGMHYYGWSRQQAVDFMWGHTATTASNVANEIDRYIGWPGQALAYMIGRLEIGRLRDEAQNRLGDAFDVRAFHGSCSAAAPFPSTCWRRWWTAGSTSNSARPKRNINQRRSTVRVTINDNELNVEVLGDKDAPVLIAHHGGGGIGSLEEPKATFGPLANTYRVVVFDARGCGRSEGKPPFSHAQWAADVDGLREWAGG